MFNWLKHRNRIERLQERYKRLMRKSFELSLTDKKASDHIHDEALRIKEQISLLRYRESH